MRTAQFVICFNDDVGLQDIVDKGLLWRALTLLLQLTNIWCLNCIIGPGRLPTTWLFASILLLNLNQIGRINSLNTSQFQFLWQLLLLDLGINRRRRSHVDCSRSINALILKII